MDEGAAFCRAERCGAVIAVGGGSSIDTAKGINLLCCNPGKIMDYAGPKNEMKKAGGLVAIPTTAGTGSELSDGLVITSPEHVKCPILATNAMAEYIVLDPLLTVGLPAGLTASTGMDVLGARRGILHIHGGVRPDRPDQRGEYPFGHTMAASGRCHTPGRR